MSTVISHLSTSLDGFVSGPDQSLENPIGVGGIRIHQWHFDPVDEADVSWRDQLLDRGDAYVMGRNRRDGRWDHVVLGRGESVLSGVADAGLTPVEVAHSPHATHIRYRVGPPPAAAGK